MQIKICGLTLQKDADAAAQLGVQFCGFIFHPESPRSITPARAASLTTGDMVRVGVFVNQQYEEILNIMNEARLSFAQLHGRQDVECARRIGAERVVRTVWPDRHTHRALLYNELQKHAGTCAWYLLDAGLAGGGNGKRLEWSDLYGLNTRHPWMLAGGLDASSIPRALTQCTPDGVDVNSGIEDAPGNKNTELMRSAVISARGASVGR